MTDKLAALPGPLLITMIALGLTIESGFLIGIAIPGTAIALTAGVAAHSGVIPLPAAIAGTALSTITGGQLGYQLGRRRRHLPIPFARITRLPNRPWPPLRRCICRRPVPVVLTAQWLASGRLLVPRVAGWSRMSHRRFTAAHTPSAIAWAATLTSTGYAATAVTRQHIGLALGLAAGSAVVLGLVVTLRQGRRRTSTEPEPPPTREVSSSTLSRVLDRQPRSRRLLAAAATALGAAAVLAGCASGPDKTFSDDVTAPGPFSTLTVTTAGAIHIEPAAPGAPAEVHRDIHYRGDTPPESVTRREGNALILDGTCGDDCLVDYRIRVPRGTHVDAHAQTGAVSATGTATTTLRADAGPITATDITGNLSAFAQAGTVDATNVSGSTLARSQAGAVTATRAGGPVDISSQAGPITAQLSRPADITARSSASDITITLPASAYRIDARDIDQPDITIPRAPGAPHTVTAQTDAGQVRVLGS